MPSFSTACPNPITALLSYLVQLQLQLVTSLRTTNLRSRSYGWQISVTMAAFQLPDHIGDKVLKQIEFYFSDSNLPGTPPLSVFPFRSLNILFYFPQKILNALNMYFIELGCPNRVGCWSGRRLLCRQCTTIPSDFLPLSSLLRSSIFLDFFCGCIFALQWISLCANRFRQMKVATFLSPFSARSSV